MHLLPICTQEAISTEAAADPAIANPTIVDSTIADSALFATNFALLLQLYSIA